ncbi:hypothetical protein KRM28CT15_46660 [Krasilnikovia sp. M28-CT-15]
MRPLLAQRQQDGRDAARWLLPATRRQQAISHTALHLPHLPLLNRILRHPLTGEPGIAITESARQIDRPIVDDLEHLLQPGKPENVPYPC